MKLEDGWLLKDALREDAPAMTSAQTMRPATIVISDWLANCQSGQWTPFEAATALKAALTKEGYEITPQRFDNGAVAMPRELTDEQADAALRATAVWLEVKGSQLTVNREKMKARYRMLVKFIEAAHSRPHRAATPDAPGVSTPVQSRPE